MILLLIARLNSDVANCHSFYIDNVVIEIVDGAESTMTSAAAESSRVTVVRIKPGRSPLRNKIPNDVFDTKYPSILEFLTDLMKGEIKGFIRPNSETAADANVIR